jgi:hypothetical protein
LAFLKYWKIRNRKADQVIDFLGMMAMLRIISQDWSRCSYGKEISKFGTMENLLANTDKLKGK